MRKLTWIAAAGYALLTGAALLWRAPESWDSIHLDSIHTKAAALVQAVAGIDVTGWVPTSVPQMDNELESWRREHPAEPLPLSPLYVVTRFQEPKGVRAVEVQISPSGQGRSVRLLGPPRSRPEVPEKEVRIQQAFRAMAGEWAGRFKADEPGQPGREERFRWIAKGPALDWRITVSLEMGRFGRATLEPRFNRGTAGRRAGFLRLGNVDFIEGPFYTAGVIWALFLCLSGGARGIIDHKLAWKAAALFAVVNVVGRFASGEGIARLMALGMIGINALIAALTGAGRIAASAGQWPRWRAFLLLLDFRWNAKSVGQEILAGLAWAGAIAAVPFVAAVVIPGAALNVATFGSAALAQSPVLSAFSPVVDRGLYGVFVFFAAAIFRRLRSPRAGLVLLVLTAAAAILFMDLFSAGLGAAILAALVSGGLLTAVYWTDGLLAVLVAAKASMLLTIVAAFLRSGAGLTLSALSLCALLGGAAALAWWIGRQGYDLEPADDPRVAAAFLSARERLKAEFSLAHQAQQRLLPASAPELEGYGLAALCHPARDVGGDLYDYFRLPDGRLGICVADVSGKGMSAALYMTLTKGVLAAAAPGCGGLLDLSHHLNRHLYAAGKRRIFVTAVIAAVDTGSGEVEFVRAGHNPVLLHSPASGGARYLAPPGIGLGMAKGALFERAMAVERVALGSGDTMVLYSDGVTEAMNAQREQYGEDRLRDVLERSASEGADSIVAEIRRDIGLFTGSEPAHDDITIVVLKARGQVTISG